jgi:hypothetical protein
MLADGSGLLVLYSLYESTKLVNRLRLKDKESRGEGDRKGTRRREKWVIIVPG